MDAISQSALEAAIAFMACCVNLCVPWKPLLRQVTSIADGDDDSRLLRGKCRNMLATCTRVRVRVRLHEDVIHLTGRRRQVKA